MSDPQQVANPDSESAQGRVRRAIKSMVYIFTAIVAGVGFALTYPSWLAPVVLVSLAAMGFGLLWDTKKTDRRILGATIGLSLVAASAGMVFFPERFATIVPKPSAVEIEKVEVLDPKIDGGTPVVHGCFWLTFRGSLPPDMEYVVAHKAGGPGRIYFGAMVDPLNQRRNEWIIGKGITSEAEGAGQVFDITIMAMKTEWVSALVDVNKEAQNGERWWSSTVLPPGVVVAEFPVRRDKETNSLCPPKP